MAQVVSVNVLELPTQANFAGQTNPCPVLGVSVADIQQISPATAAQVAAYPPATASIDVHYFMGNQIFTGSYIVGNITVANLITATNA